MAAINPAGFQNHIQNPLAAVLAQIMQGAFQNAREARQTDYQIGQDRQRQTDQDEDLAARAAAAGVDPTGKRRPDIVAELAKIMQGREATANRDAAADRASKQQLLNLRLDLDRRAADRDDADAKMRRLKTMSDMGNTWADNAGGVLEGALRFITGGRGRGAAPRADRAQIIDNNGVPMEVVTLEDGTRAMRRLPMAGERPSAGTMPPGPQTGAAVPQQADETASILERIARNGYLASGVYPPATR